MKTTAHSLILAAASAALLSVNTVQPAQATTTLLSNPGFETVGPADPIYGGRDIAVEWGGSVDPGIAALRALSGNPNILGGQFLSRSGNAYGLLGDARATNFTQDGVGSLFHLFKIPEADKLKFGGYVKLTTSTANPALSIDQAFSEIGIFRDFGDFTVGSRVDFSPAKFISTQVTPLAAPLGAFHATDWFFVEGEWDVKGLAGQMGFFSFDVVDKTPDYRIFVQVDDAFLTAVPESSTLFGLAGLGLVGLGATLKRRQSKAV